MAEYVMLELQAAGSSVTQTILREAINGCRPRQEYKYKIIFVKARVAVVAFNDRYEVKNFERCVNNNLARDGGSLEGLLVIHESDLSKFSQTIRDEIIQLVEQIESDGNSVEGFAVVSQNNPALK